jgi:hypothetical protein
MYRDCHHKKSRLRKHGIPPDTCIIFQGKHVIPGKTWDTRKNMGYQQKMEYHQKENNRQKVSGDPIYTEVQRIAWFLEEMTSKLQE